MEYRADIRDVKYNLFEWLDLDRLLKTDLFGEFGRDDLDMILDEALKVCRGSLAAANLDGDRIGARYEDGRVLLPESSHKAYHEIKEAGWLGTTVNPEFGGMGLPECVGTGVNEFITGANVALSLTIMLTRGCAHLIEDFGTEEEKALYCEKMFAGDWAGTMAMTEPSAGSDLAEIKTKAVKIEGNRYKISGEKIFITSGDQDVTENIVHAVLARTPDAPVGTKGISLFIVPKKRVNPDGSLGEDNDVKCEKIEEKMGIHGSPTCTMVFGADDKCEGFLLGRERTGLLLMFQMMNMARYEVGLQGLAVGSAAHQQALAYARERLQGRHYLNRDHHAPQVPITEHPDVKRLLLHQAANVQALRAMHYFTAYCMDMARVAEGDEKAYYQGFVEFLTPICKAWGSDRGVEISDVALQTHGGYGYIAEYPAEQYLRDARIAPIYEGTNGIQALDLVGRKFRLNGGALLKNFLALVGGTARKHEEHPLLGAGASVLWKNVQEFGATLQKAAESENAKVQVLLNAYPVLTVAGDLFGAHALIEQAALADEKLTALLGEKGVDRNDAEAFRALLADDEDAAFLQNKIQAARYFCSRVLPLCSGHLSPIASGDMSPMEAVY